MASSPEMLVPAPVGRSSRSPTPSAAPTVVTTAVILAAGAGERIQTGGRTRPKPLMQVAGLALVERAILTLKAAGIERFRVVVGAYRDEVVSAMKALPRLRDLDVTYVPCPEYEGGNGVSLAKGAGEVDEAFVLTMADHVMSVATVKQFVTRVGEHPELAHLATDPDPAHTFDIDDATKVQTHAGRIVAIDKKLPVYDQIDMGLFYFPAGAGRRIAEAVGNGARSVSDIVRGIASRDGFMVAPLADAVWQDVDTPSMAREAESRLLRSLVKPTDGWVSRVLNRPVSLFFSRYFARWQVRPNSITTFVTFMSLIAAGMAATTSWLWVAVAGILFHLASIIDGCDGEVARLTFSGSRFGEWYDTLSDNARYAIFFTATGVGIYRGNGDPLYLVAAAVFLATMTFVVLTMARYVWRNADHLTNLVVTARVIEHGRAHRTLWDRYVLPLRVFVKQDVIAAGALAFMLVGLPEVIFWLAVVGVVFVTIAVVRALKREETSPSRPKARVFVFWLVGVSILAALLYRMPLGEVWSSISGVGPKALVVFAVAGMWFVANALALSSLIGHRLAPGQLMYNQLVGEGLNAVLPLAGIGGEPFKLRNLAETIGLVPASHAIVRDRLVHAIASLVFSGALLIVSAWAPSVPAAWRSSLAILGVVLVAAGLVVAVASLTRAPSRLTAYVLKKLAALRELREAERLRRRVWAAALFYKLMGRVFGLVEVWVLMRLLGFEGSWEQVIVVGAFLGASGAIFAVVPQGLGVAEAGVTTAFALLGLPPVAGLSFGLIRRGRVVFWSLLGLALVPLAHLRGAVGRWARA